MKTIVKMMTITLMVILNVFLSNVLGQVTQATNNRNGTNWFVGWNTAGSAGSGTLDIKNDYNQPIDFWTNANHHARLDANGNFGIGLTNTNNSYMIASQPVLWHNGITSNIYVGVGAGNAIATGVNNTFVGYNSGNSNTSGSQLTLLGSGAAVTNPNLTNATAIGAEAVVAESNSLVLGNGKVNVGIGTSSPAYTLQVNGTIAAKQILVEEKNGTKDLLVLITQLQLEVEDLKQKLRCVAENEFVTDKSN